MDEDLFRKVSLERLSSPEQLDQLLRVTAPSETLRKRSWSITNLRPRLRSRI